MPSDCALEDFCKKCVPEANVNAVYVELDNLEDVDNILDVLLLDKVSLNYGRIIIIIIICKYYHAEH